MKTAEEKRKDPYSTKKKRLRKISKSVRCPKKKRGWGSLPLHSCKRCEFFKEINQQGEHVICLYPPPDKVT